MASWHRHSTKRGGSYPVQVIKRDGTLTQIRVRFEETVKPVKLQGKGF